MSESAEAPQFFLAERSSSRIIVDGLNFPDSLQPLVNVTNSDMSRRPLTVAELESLRTKAVHQASLLSEKNADHLASRAAREVRWGVASIYGPVVIVSGSLSAVLETEHVLSKRVFGALGLCLSGVALWKGTRKAKQLGYEAAREAHLLARRDNDRRDKLLAVSEAIDAHLATHD